MAETFYNIEPEKESTEEQLAAQEKATKAETNKAYNQNQKSKRYAYAQKIIAPPKDYVRPDFSKSDYGNTIKKDFSKNNANIQVEEKKSFIKINDVLKKQLEENNNAKSSVSYSLVNRKHKFLPTPIYLCETGGKIVVNITVNASGKVTEASYNNASNSSNNCLIEHALEYAKKAKFNRSTLPKSQIGTITFLFESKS
ncbi:TonB family protein [Lacinutrix sp. C3R15]|nr:TonB family protein [Lacinutrix sp. C3R15]